MAAYAFDSGLHELRRNWGWLLTIGIILVILGIIALVDSIAVSIVSMFLFGWVLLIGGIVEGVQAFRHRRSGHFSLHLINAVFSIVIGVMLLRSPLAGALIVTLLLASYFVVVGIFRIFAALTVRVPGSGWALTDGIITLILGILVWAQWPESGLWIVGLFIGINLITSGWSEVMLAVAVRRPAPQAA